MRTLVILLFLVGDVAPRMYQNPHHSHVQVSEDHPIHILVPLPVKECGDCAGKNPFHLTLSKVKPVIDLAIENVTRRGLVCRNCLEVHYRDSDLSDAVGPNVAISQLVQNELDVIIGYAFVYALAPVARMSPSWSDADSFGIPIITPVGLAVTLDDKVEYALMTRISSPYKNMCKVVRNVFHQHGWSSHFYAFHNHRIQNGPAGECFLLMASLKGAMRHLAAKQENPDHNFWQFDEKEGIHRKEIKEHLRDASFIANGGPFLTFLFFLAILPVSTFFSLCTLVTHSLLKYLCPGRASHASDGILSSVGEVTASSSNYRAPVGVWPADASLFGVFLATKFSKCLQTLRWALFMRIHSSGRA